jgi:hypothetical protein
VRIWGFRVRAFSFTAWQAPSRSLSNLPPQEVFSLYLSPAIMQDDRAFTFREIHGSSEALLVVVEKVECIALIESNDPSPSCFLLLELYPWGGLKYDFILTHTHDYERSALSNCITVPCGWTHELSLDEMQMPAYRIWDGIDLDKPSRPIRSSLVVFYRVVQFARSQIIQRIWIN